MQFLEIKTAAGGTGNLPGFPAIPLLCLLSVLFSFPSFFRNSAFYRHFLHAACFFSVLYRKNRHAAAERTVCALR